MNQIKELRSDENDALFDKTNMLYKEFPSDFRQIRYFTLLIVQSAPLEIKEINLLEQQISEVIKNAVKHGNGCDINKKVRVWYSFSPTHAHLIVEDEGEGFQELENEWNVCTSKTLKNLPILFLLELLKVMIKTAETLCLQHWNTGMAVLYTTANAMELPCLKNSSKNVLAFP